MRHSRRRRAGLHVGFEPLEGRALLSAVTGDFNHDGVADLAIGVPAETVNGVNAGAVQVIYGQHTVQFSFGLTDKGAQLISEDTIGGTLHAGDNFGAALAVGDFNGDGFADLAVGVSGQTVGGASGAGSVVILFGSKAGLKTTGVQVWNQNSANILDTAESGDHFGAALAVGDFNGDRRPDLAIGAPNEDVGSNGDAGSVNIIYGGIGGLSSKNNQFFSQSTAGMNGGAAAGDLFGSALAAGDFDANGFQDLAIGAPGQKVNNNTAAGAVNVIYGSRNGLKTLNNQFWTADSANVQGASNANAKFGTALAAGDFNGDSRSDLAIGASGEDIPKGVGAAKNNVGAVHVLFGGTTRLTAAKNQFWHENVTGISSTTFASGDGFGSALAAGQLNSDHVADLVIGIPNASPSATLSGAGGARVMFGVRATGLVTTNTEIFNRSSIGGAQANDHFGSFLTIGDFNGDRIGDLAAGVPRANPNSLDAGSTAAIYGQPGALPDGTPTPLTVNGIQIWSPGSGGLLALNSELNLLQGQTFLNNNRIKPGVVTLPDGLQYKVITQGTGARPTATSNVTVSYVLSDINGTTLQSNPSFTRSLQSSLIQGFVEALLLMPVGSEWQVFIPSNLAYGANGNSPLVGPNETIVYDLKLISIN